MSKGSGKKLFTKIAIVNVTNESIRNEKLNTDALRCVLFGSAEEAGNTFSSNEKVYRPVVFSLFLDFIMMFQNIFSCIR